MLRRFAYLILILGFGLTVGCSDADVDHAPHDAAETPAVAEAPAAEAAAADSVLYVDVRTPEEFAEGHVAGALLIPHDEMETRWEELSPYRDREIAVYCRSGRRSGLAREVLLEKGFDNVVNVGGFESLRDSGLPVEEGAP